MVSVILSTPFPLHSLAKLTPDEHRVRDAIANAGEDGIWARDLRELCNMEQPQLMRALKSLERQLMIKWFKDENKRFYILFELQPVAGRVEDDGFGGMNNPQFVMELGQLALHLASTSPIVRLVDVLAELRRMGVCDSVALNANDVRYVFEFLVESGDLEALDEVWTVLVWPQRSAGHVPVVL